MLGILSVSFSLNPLPELPLTAHPNFASILRPPSDLTRINPNSSTEVNYWCQTLNCTETRLRNAVLAVGTLVADVQNYLNR